MSALSVGPGVIRETVRLAALEVPGVLRVGRGGPRWRDAHRRARPIRDPRPRRPGPRHALAGRPPAPAAWCRSPRRSARPSARAVVRLLGLELGGVTVLVDGVGA